MWTADRLLSGYQAYTWEIPDAAVADGEPDEPLTATLVRRNEPLHHRAVLYVHGWNDYFFQTHLADFWEKRGFDFYAIDLRRYGRNLRPGLFAGYITSLDDYASELDEAYRLIGEDGHDLITLTGHSTGGLIASLWADQTERQLNGLVLNSPWLDMSGSDLLLRAMRPLLTSAAALTPTSGMPMGESPFYADSCSATSHGEWDYDLDFKSNKAFIPRLAWAKAIMTGQAKVAAGLEIGCSVLMMTSARSDLEAAEWDESLKSVDIVLDVDKLANQAWRLGRVVTLVRIEGGMHDLILSPHPVRDEVFAEIARWLKVYVR